MFYSFIVNNWVPQCLKSLEQKIYTAKKERFFLGPDPTTISNDTIHHNILNVFHKGSTFPYTEFYQYCNKLLVNTITNKGIDSAQKSSSYNTYYRNKLLENKYKILNKIHENDCKNVLYNYMIDNLNIASYPENNSDKFNTQRFEKAIDKIRKNIAEQVSQEASSLVVSNIKKIKILSNEDFTKDEIDQLFNIFIK